MKTMKLSPGQLRGLIKQVVRESRGDSWEDKEREDLALQALSAGAKTVHDVADFMLDSGTPTTQTIAREVLGSLSRKGKAARGMMGWRRTNFGVDEAVCPKCGNKNAYIGMNDVECPERKCSSFSQKQYDDVGMKDDVVDASVEKIYKASCSDNLSWAKTVCAPLKLDCEFVDGKADLHGNPIFSVEGPKENIRKFLRDYWLPGAGVYNPDESDVDFEYTTDIDDV
jgi:hypothetical protein